MSVVNLPLLALGINKCEKWSEALQNEVKQKVDHKIQRVLMNRWYYCEF